jgi:hypothetical protein
MMRFCWELKAGILKLQDLRTSEVGINLTSHIGGIGGRSWSAENLLTHLRRDPLTQRSMSLGQKKLRDFRCCKFVIVPNSKVASIGVFLELETVLAVHFFFVKACMAEHALEEL